MKKVLIITYYWPPSGGAGVQRWLKFSRYLPEFGVEPFVLTVDPHYATYPQTDESLEKQISPDLRVFRTKSFEPLRVFSGIFGKEKVPYGGFTNVNKKSLFNTVFRFIRGNLFIPDARSGWKRYAFKKAVELIQQFGIDTVITTGPPHSTHLVGLKLKRKTGIRWMADFRDPWTDIYYYQDMLHTPLAGRIDRRMEISVLKEADNVIAINRSIRKLLVNRAGSIDRTKVTVITNGYDEEDFKASTPPPGEFVITYSGTISEHYNPVVFFTVLSRLVSECPDIKFRFRIAGNISQKFEHQVRLHSLIDIFEYTGYVSHEKLTSYLTSSSAFLYVFPETSAYTGASGKLFEYLAARRPVIAIDSPGSDASAIIDECEAGKSFSHEDENGLYNYMASLVQEFRQKGKISAGNGKHINYSRRKLTKDLADLILQ